MSWLAITFILIIIGSIIYGKIQYAKGKKDALDEVNEKLNMMANRYKERS